MMLLSVLLPRLYIHCHQFTTQPLDLNPVFIHLLSYLFVTAVGVGAREHVRVVCVHMYDYVWIWGVGGRN